jgi:hypothetical protein
MFYCFVVYERKTTLFMLITYHCMFLFLKTAQMKLTAYNSASVHLTFSMATFEGVSKINSNKLQTEIKNGGHTGQHIHDVCTAT